jgi:hypothetical protein
MNFDGFVFPIFLVMKDDERRILELYKSFDVSFYYNKVFFDIFSKFLKFLA